MNNDYTGIFKKYLTTNFFILWQLIWMFILASAGTIETISLWPLMIGSVGLSFRTSIKLARGRKWLPVFVVGRAILAFMLTYLIYRYVYFAFNFRL